MDFTQYAGGEKMKVVANYADAFGNGAQVDYKRGPAYNGGPLADHYRLTCCALYDGGYVYHVSVHETQADAEEKLHSFSCGTFKKL